MSYLSRITLVLLLAGAPTLAAAQPRAVGNVTITPDVVYGHKDGMALTFDVFRPADANGAAILYMVSGGWVSRWIQPENAVRGFQGLLDRGFTVIAVRHGSSPLYKVPSAEADVRLALRYVRMRADDLDIDPERIGVYGGSAGGHLSLMLGVVSDEGLQDDDPVQRTPSRVAAVVAYYPPSDLRTWVGPSDRFPALDFQPELAEGISPILYATADDPPTLIIHGDADRLVPLAHGQRMYDALHAAGVESEMVVIPGGDHGFTNPEHRARAQGLMVAWFDRLLASPRAVRRQ
jgi:acetyl esterase/lipase